MSEQCATVLFGRRCTSDAVDGRGLCEGCGGVMDELFARVMRRPAPAPAPEPTPDPQPARVGREP